MNLEISLSIIGTLLAILGIPQIFGLLWKDIITKLFSGGISWKEVEDLTLILAENIKDKKPDLIIGVGRGGIISAGLLCSKITNDGSLEKEDSSNQNTKTIKMETINTIKKIDKSAPIIEKRKVSYPYYYEIQNIDFDLSMWNDKFILIIIGETITGNTLFSTKEQIKNICLQKQYNIDIKLATLILHDMKHQEAISRKIDFIGKTYNKKIIMPWKH